MDRYRFKKHWDDNKKFYIGAAAGIGIAGITGLIMKGCHADVLSVSDGSEKITVQPFTFFFE